MNPFSENLPNVRRIATARAALTTARAVRSDFPVMSDNAVIELLADLRHFCAGRDIAFDPARHVNSRRTAWRTLTKMAGVNGIQVPRSPALRRYAACVERNLGFNDHVDSWTRQPPHAGAVSPCADGSEANGDGSPCREHQNGRL